MTTIITRATPTSFFDIDLPGKIAAACGVMLLAAFCVLSYGLDLSAGLF